MNNEYLPHISFESTKWLWPNFELQMSSHWKQFPNYNIERKNQQINLLLQNNSQSKKQSNVHIYYFHPIWQSHIQSQR